MLIAIRSLLPQGKSQEERRPDHQKPPTQGQRTDQVKGEAKQATDKIKDAFRH
jgi:hypothetical protein